MRLPEVYTQQEMDFNNLTQMHRKAYETLSSDIKNAHRRLKKYGFTLFEIEEIIRHKVYNDNQKTKMIITLNCPLTMHTTPNDVLLAIDVQFVRKLNIAEFSDTNKHLENPYSRSAK